MGHDTLPPRKGSVPCAHSQHPQPPHPHTRALPGLRRALTDTHAQRMILLQGRCAPSFSRIKVLFGIHCHATVQSARANDVRAGAACQVIAAFKSDKIVTEKQQHS